MGAVAAAVDAVTFISLSVCLCWNSQEGNFTNSVRLKRRGGEGGLRLSDSRAVISPREEEADDEEAEATVPPRGVYAGDARRRVSHVRGRLQAGRRVLDWEKTSTRPPAGRPPLH